MDTYPWPDRTIAEVNFGKIYRLEVVQNRRTKGVREQYLDAQADLILRAGDELFIEGQDEDAQQLAADLAIRVEAASEDDIVQRSRASETH